MILEQPIILYTVLCFPGNLLAENNAHIHIPKYAHQYLNQVIGNSFKKTFRVLLETVSPD